MVAQTTSPASPTKADRYAYSTRSCAESSEYQRRRMRVKVLTFDTTSLVPPRRAHQGPDKSTRQAARDRVVPVVDRSPELLHPDDAGQGDKGNQQRVLDEVLTLILAHEPNKQVLHKCISVTR